MNFEPAGHSCEKQLVTAIVCAYDCAALVSAEWVTRDARPACERAEFTSCSRRVCAVDGAGVGVGVGALCTLMDTLADTLLVNAVSVCAPALAVVGILTYVEKRPFKLARTTGIPEAALSSSNATLAREPNPVPVTVSVAPAATVLGDACRVAVAASADGTAVTLKIRALNRPATAWRRTNWKCEDSG